MAFLWPTTDAFALCLSTSDNRCGPHRAYIGLSTPPAHEPSTTMADRGDDPQIHFLDAARMLMLCGAVGVVSIAANPGDGNAAQAFTSFLLWLLGSACASWRSRQRQAATHGVRRPRPCRPPGHWIFMASPPSRARPGFSKPTLWCAVCGLLLLSYCTTTSS
jgi:hypothetical protein